MTADPVSEQLLAGVKQARASIAAAIEAAEVGEPDYAAIRLRAGEDALRAAVEQTRAATNGHKPGKVADDPEPGSPEAQWPGRVASVASRLNHDGSVYIAEALVKGIPVKRELLDARVLRAIGEPIGNGHFVLTPELVVAVEANAAPIGPEAASAPAASVAAGQNGRNGRAPHQLAVRRLDGIEMRSIEWLDKPLWQRSAFELVAGKKGSGKGTYLGNLEARVSRGELHGRPMNVLVIASEDSAEIDVKPRVRAAGGDETRIYSVTGEFRLPRDVDQLRNLALEIGEVGLIIIDPVGNHLGGANTDGEGPVRDAIAPLNDLANELDCLIIGVRHLSKDTTRGALPSVLGSTAWVDVPRAVLVVAADDEEDMLFHIAVAAGNRSARGAGRSFRIELADVGLKEPVTRAVETGPSSKSLDLLLGDTADQSSRAVKRQSAAAVILRELAAAPRPMEHLKAICAAEVGASGETTWRAANQLKADGKARCTNSGPGTTWLWYLTSATATDADDFAV